MKFSIKDYLCKCDQIRRKSLVWSHLTKKSFMENFIFCATIVNYKKIKFRLILIYRFSSLIYSGLGAIPKLRNAENRVFSISLTHMKRFVTSSVISPICVT